MKTKLDIIEDDVTIPLNMIICIKNISTLFIVTMLLVASVTVLMCVNAPDTVASNGVDIIDNLNLSDNNNLPSEELVECHQCGCHSGCHFSLQSTLKNIYYPNSQEFFISSDGSYLSLLNSPPFQPPKV